MAQTIQLTSDLRYFLMQHVTRGLMPSNLDTEVKSLSTRELTALGTTFGYECFFCNKIATVSVSGTNFCLKHGQSQYSDIVSVLINKGESH